MHKLNISEDELVSVDILRTEQVATIEALLRYTLELMYWLRSLGIRLKFDETGKLVTELANKIVEGRVEDALDTVRSFIYSKFGHYLTPPDRAYLDEDREAVVYYLMKINVACWKTYNTVRRILRTYRGDGEYNFVNWMLNRTLTKCRVDEEVIKRATEKALQSQDSDAFSRVVMESAINNVLTRATGVIHFLTELIRALAHNFLHIETLAIPVTSDVLDMFLEETAEKLENLHLLDETTVVTIEIPILLEHNNRTTPTILYTHFYQQEGKVMHNKPLILEEALTGPPMTINLTQDTILHKLVKHKVLRVTLLGTPEEDKHSKIADTIAETFRKHIGTKVINIKLGGKDNKLEPVYVVTTTLTRPNVERVETRQEAGITTFSIAKVNILEFALPLTQATVIDDKVTVQKFGLNTDKISEIVLPNFIIVAR